MCRRKFRLSGDGILRQYAAINKFINGLDYIVNIVILLTSHLIPCLIK